MDERQIGPTNFSNLAVGIGWLRVAENWAVLKKTKKKRGHAVGTTTKSGLVCAKPTYVDFRRPKRAQIKASSDLAKTPVRPPFSIGTHERTTKLNGLGVRVGLPCKAQSIGSRCSWVGAHHKLRGVSARKQGCHETWLRPQGCLKGQFWALR